MDVVTKELDVYIVNGKEFVNKEDALAYEKEIEQKLSCTYYRVQYSPDLTEGRGYYKAVILAVPRISPNNVIYQYLFEHFGNPIAMVMGVAPMDNWVLGTPHNFSDISDLEAFLSTEISVGCGDYRIKIKPDIYYIDSLGKGKSPMD